jgi:Flp pilus assembly protein TadD
VRRVLLYSCLAAAFLGAAAVIVALLAQRPAWEAQERAQKRVKEAKELGAEGKRAEAWVAIDQALVADPGNPQALRERGLQYVVRGMPEQAARTLAKAAEAQPFDPGVAWETAVAFEGIGRTADAVRWFRRVAALEPNNGVAHALIARGLLALGDAEGALGEAERGARLSPRTPLAHVVLGSARLRTGDTVGAKAAFEDALQLRPADTEVLLNLAQVSVALRRQDQAAEYLARALRVARTDPKVRAAVERAIGR